MWRTFSRSSAILMTTVLLSGCGGSNEPDREDTRPLVVTSIFPVGDLAQTMVGDQIRVEVVLPPGASPATFDVTPRQIQDFGKASVFLMIGGGLDEWLARLPVASGGNARVVRLSEEIQLLASDEEEDEHEHGAESGHSHGAGNPHIWLDPVMVRDQLLPKLEASLVAAFPEDAGDIRGRAQGLADSLGVLDREIREALRPLTNRALITTHAAWSYFALRYDLEEAGVIHAHPGQEPSGRELAALLEVARSKGIPCLFTEPQLGEIALAAIATELDLPTRMLDPLGGPDVEGRGNYFDLLRFNTRQLVEGLGGPSR